MSKNKTTTYIKHFATALITCALRKIFHYDFQQFQKVVGIRVSRTSSNNYKLEGCWKNIYLIHKNNSEHKNTLEIHIDGTLPLGGTVQLVIQIVKKRTAISTSRF